MRGAGWPVNELMRRQAGGRVLTLSGDAGEGRLPVPCPDGPGQERGQAGFLQDRRGWCRGASGAGRCHVPRARRIAPLLVLGIGSDLGRDRRHLGHRRHPGSPARFEPKPCTPSVPSREPSQTFRWEGAVPLGEHGKPRRGGSPHSVVPCWVHAQRQASGCDMN